MPKDGKKTSEFALTVAAYLAALALVIVNHALGEGHWAADAVSLIVAGLASLGYDFSRAKVKSEEAKAEAVRLVSEAEKPNPS